jgi:predicted TPR repeat methyltransferase
MPNKNAIDHYEKMAEHYDETVATAGYHLPTDVYDWLKPYITEDMKTVLDLGIGTGLSSEQFQKHGFIITGVDGSETMLEQCRAKKIGTRLIQADLGDGTIPVTGETFDIILCIGMFEFVLEPNTFLKNVSALAAPNALFVLVIRDPALNPQFTSMRLGANTIDRVAYEQDGVVAVHHEWSNVKQHLYDGSFTVLEERQLIAYKSPTQHFDTVNRVVFCRYTGQ